MPYRFANSCIWHCPLELSNSGSGISIIIRLRGGNIDIADNDDWWIYDYGTQNGYATDNDATKGATYCAPSAHPPTRNCRPKTWNSPVYLIVGPSFLTSYCLEPLYECVSPVHTAVSSSVHYLCRKPFWRGGIGTNDGGRLRFEVDCCCCLKFPQ